MAARDFRSELVGSFSEGSNGNPTVAMIEAKDRISAPRPGDLVAKFVYGVPVWTRTRLIAIEGRRQVEAVEIERNGQPERVACDGVIFAGGFVPDAAPLSGSSIAIDPGTGAVNRPGTGDVGNFLGIGADDCFTAITVEQRNGRWGWVVEVGA